jgi:hypothetical protein
MLTSAEFFESFDEAGFLKPATWTPFGGLARTHRQGTLPRAFDDDMLDGALRTIDHEIQYVTDQLPGLAEGAKITVDGTPFRSASGPSGSLDGTVSRAELARSCVSHIVDQILEQFRRASGRGAYARPQQRRGDRDWPIAPEEDVPFDWLLVNEGADRVTESTPMRPRRLTEEMEVKVRVRSSRASAGEGYLQARAAAR